MTKFLFGSQSVSCASSGIASTLSENVRNHKQRKGLRTSHSNLSEGVWEKGTRVDNGIVLYSSLLSMGFSLELTVHVEGADKAVGWDLGLGGGDLGHGGVCAIQNKRGLRGVWGGKKEKGVQMCGGKRL